MNRECERIIKKRIHYGRRFLAACCRESSILQKKSKKSSKFRLAADTAKRAVSAASLNLIWLCNREGRFLKHTAIVGEEEYIYGIRQVVGQIPTRFQITNCNGTLLIAAAHQVVQGHRDRIVKFLEVQP